MRCRGYARRGCLRTTASHTGLIELQRTKVHPIYEEEKVREATHRNKSVDHKSLAVVKVLPIGGVNLLQA